MIEAFRKSEEELDKVNEDLARQMTDLTQRIKTSKDLMVDRQKQLEQ